METRSASEIEQSMEKLLQDLRQVVQDGEELLKAGARDLGERGSAAREKLAAALEAARETQQRLREKAILPEADGNPVGAWMENLFAGCATVARVLFASN